MVSASNGTGKIARSNDDSRGSSCRMRGLLLCSTALIGVAFAAPAVAQTSVNQGHITSPSTATVTGDGANQGTALLLSGAGAVTLDGALVNNGTGTPNADGLSVVNVGGGGLGISFRDNASALTTTQIGGAAIYVSQTGANLGIGRNVSGNIFTGSYGERYISSGAIFYERTGSGGSDIYIGTGSRNAGVHLTGNSVAADFAAPIISNFATGIAADSADGASITTLGGTISTALGGTGIAASAAVRGGVTIDSQTAISAGRGIVVTSAAGATIRTSGAGTINASTVGIEATSSDGADDIVIHVGAAIGGTSAPGTGVLASTTDSSTGAIRITTAAAITAANRGIDISQISYTHRGAIDVGANITAGTGIHSFLGTYDMTVAAGATVTGTAVNGYGIYAVNTPGSVTNSGAIQATGIGGIGVYLNGDGVLTNNLDATISGAIGARFVNGGTVTNAGSITGSAGAGLLSYGGTTINTGSITGSTHGINNIANIFTLDNIGGTISGGTNALYMNDGVLRLTNSGAIETIGGTAGSGSAGIYVNVALTALNHQITNSGTIRGGSDATHGYGVDIDDGILVLANNSGGIITGGTGAIRLNSDDLATLNLNAGSTVTGQILSTNSGARTVNVAGLLDGNYNGSAGSGATTLTLSAGGSITGDVAMGNAAGVFNWTGGTLGGTLSGGSPLSTLNVSPGAGQTVTLNSINRFFGKVQSGTLILNNQSGLMGAWQVSDGALLRVGDSFTTTGGTFAGLNAAGGSLQIDHGVTLTNNSNINVSGGNAAKPVTVTVLGTLHGTTGSSGSVVGGINSYWSAIGNNGGGYLNVVNSGTITAPNHALVGAVSSYGNVTNITNSGTLAGGTAGSTQTAYGFVVQSGTSTVTNSGSASLIRGAAAAIRQENGTLNLTNAGSMIGTNAAIDSSAGNLNLTNQAGGFVVGGDAGIVAAGTVKISNAGTIGSGTVASGVFTRGGNSKGLTLAGGTITNSGTIDAAGAGVYSSGAMTLTNSGTIHSAATGFGNLDGVVFNNAAAAQTILNSGTISSDVYSGIMSIGALTLTNAGAGHVTGGTDSNFGQGVQLAGIATINNYGTISGSGAVTGVRQNANAATTINLFAGSTTGSILAGGGHDVLALYNGQVNASAVTQDYSDAVSGAAGSMLLQNSGTLAAAAFGAIDLGAGDDELRLRGFGTGAQAGTFSIATSTGAETLTKADSGTWTLTGAAITPGIRINAGDGGAPGSDGLLVFDGTTGLTGDIYVNAATIRATGSGAFGTGTVHMVDPTVQFANGIYNNAFLLEVQSPATADPSRFQGVGTGVPLVILNGRISQGSGVGVDPLQPVVFSTDGTGTPLFLLTNQTNSWAGTTTIDAGVVVEGSSAAISGGSIVNNGHINLNNGAADVVETRAISGSGSFYKRGTGNTTLTGVGSWTGATFIETGGTLTVSGGAAIGDLSFIYMDDGATLALAGDEIIGGLSGAGDVKLGVNILTLGGNNGSSTFSGVITDQAPVTYIGSWTVADGPHWSTNPPTYTGQETAALLFGGNADDYRTSTNGANTATINDLAWYNTYGAFPADYVLGSATYRVDTGAVGYNKQGDTSAFVGDHVSNPHVNYAFTGGLSLGGGLTKIGAGTLTLTGVNDYTGLTSITGGRLAISGGSAIADTGSVSVGAGGAFSVLSSETIASLNGAGATLLASGSTLTLAKAAGGYSGTMIGVGTLALGGGAWTLDGALTQSGGVTMADGTKLVLTATGSINSSGAAGVTDLAGGISVVNAGAITGGSGHAGIQAVSATITNSGTITSTGGDHAIQLSASGTITNQSGGSIGSGGNAIVLSGSTGTVLLNLQAGSITGAINATNGGTRAVTIGGTLNGVYTATGSGVDNLTLTKAGAMTSAALGAGNDSFLWQGGSIGGLIDGGTGNDSFTGDLGIGASGSLSLGSLSNFDSYNSQSGNLTLTGNRSGGAGWELSGGSLTLAGSLTNTGVDGNGVQTAGITVNGANTTVNILSGAALSASAQNAIQVNFVDNTTINNNGGTIGGSNGVAGVRVNRSATINNNAGGWITSNNLAGMGIGNTGAGVVINNAANATISGANVGIDNSQGLEATAPGLTVNNSGTISSFGSGYAIRSTDGSITVTNAAGGIITGGLAGAILTGGAGAATLDLQAGSTVTGNIVSVGSGTRSVVLRGMINGAYDASAGTGVDIVTMYSGATLTDGDLGAGDDIFRYFGGTIRGVVDGGAGNDTLFADFGTNGSGTLALDHFTGFEAFGLTAGDLTITGAAASPGAAIYAGNGAPAGTISFVDTVGLSGDIYVNGGDIRAMTAGAFGTGNIHMIDPTAHFGATGVYANNISLEVQSPANVNPSTLSADDGVTAMLTGAITQGAGVGVDPAQPLVIAGAGTIILTNAANHWAGTTTVLAGSTLQGSSGTISGSDILVDGHVVYAQPTSGTVSQNVSGTGLVAVSGLGAGQALTYAGTATNGQGFQILDGSTLINSGSIHSGAISSAVTIANGGAFVNSGSVTGAVGNIGAGAATVTNSGTIDGVVYSYGSLLTFNNQLGGVVSGGTSAAFINTGAIHLINAGDVSGGYAAVAVNNAGTVIDNSGRIVAGTFNGADVTLNPNSVGIGLQSGGVVNNLTGGLIAGGALAITSSGALTLTNAAGATITGGSSAIAAYAGATINNAGTIGTSGAFYAIGLSNGGTIVNSGTIMGGSNAHEGWAVNSNGTLNFTNQAGGTIGGARGAIQNFGAATIDLQAGSTTVGAISLIGPDASTMSIGGSFTGALDFGTGNDVLTLLGGAAIGAGSTVHGGAGTDSLVLAGADNGAINVTNILGFENRTMDGTGVWTLTGNDAMASDWRIKSGTLVAAGGSAINDHSIVTVAAPGTLRLDANEAIGGLLGSGSVALGSNMLVVTGTGSFDGTIGGTGGVTIFGNGAQTLSGANSYTGQTLVGGTLTLGASDVLADASTLALAGGTLNLGTHSDTVAIAALSGTINGTGTLTAGEYQLSDAIVNANLGGGTLFHVQGASTLTGTAAATTVHVIGGTLLLGAAERLSDGAALQIDAGGVLDLGQFTEAVDSALIGGTLNGTGTLTAGAYGLFGATINADLGTGALVAGSGSSRLNGTAAASTVQVAGTLTLGDSERLSDTALLLIDADGVLDLGLFAETIDSAAIGGTLNGTGTLTAQSYALTGAAVNANLGAGAMLVGAGSSTLNGTAAANAVQVAGTLLLGAAERLSDAALLQIDADGVLDLGMFAESVDSALIGGTLNGTGTLTAQSYALTGAAVNANLGTGAMVVGSGSSRLNGSAAASTIQVVGTLVLGDNDRLNDTALVQIDADGVLDLGAFAQTVGGLYGTGAVALAGGSLTANQAVDSAFAGAIDGQGDFVKSGSGLLNLTGASSFTGTTSVTGGLLVVNGSLASTVSLSNGGQIGGNGTVGGLTVGGASSLAPGNSVGVMKVAGDLTFQAGSFYDVEVTPTTSDVTLVSGTTTIQGGTVRVTADGTAYHPLTTHMILNSAGGVSGAFAGVTSNLAFLTPSLEYTPTLVKLVLRRNDVNFAAVAQSSNQLAVANAVQQQGIGSALGDALLVQSADGARAAFNSLAGEIYASTGTSVMAQSHAAHRTILDAGKFAADGLAVWGTGTIGHSDFDANARLGHEKLATERSGYFTGISFAQNGFHASVAAGQSDSDGRVRSRLSGAGVKTDYVGGDIGYASVDGIQVQVGALFGWHDIDTSRQVVFAGFNEAERLKQDGTSRQVFAELGYAVVDNEAFKLETYAGYSHIRNKIDAGIETGGAAALSIAQSTRAVNYLDLGLRAQSNYDVGGATLSPNIAVTWERAWDDRAGRSIAAFGNGTPFAIAGAGLPKDALQISGGLKLDLGAVRVGIGYDGTIARRHVDHAAKANISVRF